MPRRAPIHRAVAMAVVMAFPASVLADSGSTLPQPALQGPPPNVLVILTDDQRESGTMQALRATRRLFEQGGMRYTRAYATTPNCCPSRASIFTGNYAHNHRVRRNIIGDAPQLNQESTVQRYLHDGGYRTAIYGKYLNNWDLSLSPPYFDDWAVFSQPNRYYNVNFNVNGSVRNIARYSNDFITGRALRFLQRAEEDDTQPWFLFLAPYAPHMPAIVEPKYRKIRVRPLLSSPGTDELDRIDKPFYVQVRSASLARAAAIRTRQLRSLRSVDDMVKKVFGTIEQLREPNTLAFFLSDNGYMWAEHGVIGKTLPYTESVKVPFFARWPGLVPAGVQDSRLVANIDIAPTILEAAGIQPDRGFPIDGQSLFSGVPRDRLLLEYWPEATGRPPVWASILTSSYQYVEYYGDDETTPIFSEYYDLASDPWQLSNVLGDQDYFNDPVIPDLSRRLIQDRSCAGAECP